MRTDDTDTEVLSAEGLRIGVVTALFNRSITERLKEGADDDSIDKIVAPRKQGDGSYSHDCPIYGCWTNTFELKRHLIDPHSNLSVDSCKFAITLSHKMTKNKLIGNQKAEPTPTPTKIVKNTNKITNLVNRKSNPKLCPFCNKLYMNLSDHIPSAHKLKRDTVEYERCIRDAIVIPLCYTKLENGIRVKLCGDELKDAQALHEENIVSQTETLKDLKTLRREIDYLQKQIIEVADKTEYHKLKEELKTAKDAYLALRYKDWREYSENTRTWKEHFLKHLEDINHNDAKRAVRMAMDDLLPFERSRTAPLEYSDNCDGQVIRLIITQFRNQDGTTSTSKIRYVRMFEQLLKFLITDVSSPERHQCESNEEILSRGIKLQDVTHAITNQIYILRKRKGADLIKTKKKAKSKLITQQEVDGLTDDTRSCILQVSEDIKNSVHLNYSNRTIAKVRNSLITIGTLRLGRRSMELTKMTTMEVDEAEGVFVGEQKYYFVKVQEQKTTSSTGTLK